jgi:hypothetical protein
MAENSRRRMIAVGAAALLIGFVLALLVAGGDDDDQAQGPETGERTATTETTAGPGTETATAPQAVEPVEPAVPQRDLAGIQATVVLLVESAEVRDGRGVCRALGEAPIGSSRDVAQDCADRAGIDLSALPGSDELSFEEVDAAGDRGRVELASGDVITLRRRGGRWVVTGIRS